jgi:aminoacylase
VIAPEIVITYDLRITPEQTENDMKSFIEKTCSEAGSGISYEFILKDPLTEKTPLTNESSWWIAFKAACDEM